MIQADFHCQLKKKSEFSKAEKQTTLGNGFLLFKANSKPKYLAHQNVVTQF